MRRLLLPIAAGLVLGGLVHIITIFAMPRLAQNDAYARLSRLGDINQVVQLPDPSPFEAVLPRMDPSIAVYDGRGRLVENPAARYGFTSTEVLYQADGNVEIWLSPRVHDGNWLPTGENERIAAVLRLYDTPTGIFSRAEVAEMPKVVTERCP